MAFVYSDLQTVVNGPAFGQPLSNRVKANKFAGRIRVFRATYTAPAAGMPGIGDKIVWGKLPVKARPLGYLGRLEFAVGTASCTINLGDNVSAARHLAATSIAAAGSAIPTAASANGADFETSDDSNSLGNNFGSATDDCTLISTVAGAQVAANQVITLTMPYVTD
jgi:hypothetical protein